MTNYTEYEDRFDAVLTYNFAELTVSIDKPVSKAELDDYAKLIDENFIALAERSLEYIEDNKPAHNIEYIDDLESPMILVGEGEISVYWFSEKGDKKGEPIIGVDFDSESLEASSMSVGDWRESVTFTFIKKRIICRFAFFTPHLLRQWQFRKL